MKDVITLLLGPLPTRKGEFGEVLSNFDRQSVEDPSQANFGYGTFDDKSSTSAFTNTGGSDTPAGFAMTFNAGGGFFTNSADPGGFTGGSAAAQAYVVIHELAHYFVQLNSGSGFRNHNGDSAAQGLNQKDVLTHCKGVIKKAKW